MASIKGTFYRKKREALGLTRAQVGEMVGIHAQTVNKIESGEIEASRHMLNLEKVLGIVSKDKKRGRAATTALHYGTQPSPVLVEEQLPVFGSHDNADGTMSMSPEPIDYLPNRPGPLAKVKGAYAVMISNADMDPVFEIGDAVLVHPGLPPVSGRDVLLRKTNHNGHDIDAKGNPDPFVIARLVGNNATEWIIRQHGRTAEFAVPRSILPVCHRVVGKISRL